jgi:hypothetical protein
MDVTHPFEAEIARLQHAGAPGMSGRLRDLFDWLAERGPDAPSASQVEIAEGVFGAGSADADDATVRVYVHRLRKKIEDYYATNPAGEGGARIDLPPGTYALRLNLPEVDVAPTVQPDTQRNWRLPVWSWLAIALLGIGALFVAQKAMSMMQPNAIWQPLLESDRPVLVVLGDYYIYGEIDPVRPEEGRLIRDFRVNNAADLMAMQEANPERYGLAEDQGLNYLPFSAAYALNDVAPLLKSAGKEVLILPASAVEPDMLNRYDIIYIGLLSGMGMLEDVNFMNSTFRIGESYDELRDNTNAKTYTSGEARTVATPAFYRDYGYIAQGVTPGGAVLVVLAGSRDTGLRGISLMATQANLPEELEAAADAPFEALVQVTGQKGADLSSRLLIARHRRSDADVRQ